MMSMERIGWLNRRQVYVCHMCEFGANHLLLMWNMSTLYLCIFVYCVLSALTFCFDCDWLREGSLCGSTGPSPTRGPSPRAQSFLVIVMDSITCTLRFYLAWGSSQWAQGPQTFGSSIPGLVCEYHAMQCNNVRNWLIAQRKMEHCSVCWQSFMCVVHVSLVVCASLPYYDSIFYITVKKNLQTLLLMHS